MSAEYPSSAVTINIHELLALMKPQRFLLYGKKPYNAVTRDVSDAQIGRYNLNETLVTYCT